MTEYILIDTPWAAGTLDLASMVGASTTAPIDPTTLGVYRPDHRGLTALLDEPIRSGTIPAVVSDCRARVAVVEGDLSATTRRHPTAHGCTAIYSGSRVGGLIWKVPTSANLDIDTVDNARAASAAIWLLPRVLESVYSGATEHRRVPAMLSAAKQRVEEIKKHNKPRNIATYLTHNSVAMLEQATTLENGAYPVTTTYLRSTAQQQIASVALFQKFNNYL